jgi:hypothetical protein
MPFQQVVLMGLWETSSHRLRVCGSPVIAGTLDEVDVGLGGRGIVNFFD